METSIIPALTAPFAIVAEADKSSYVLPEMLPSLEVQAVRIIENLNPLRIESRRVVRIVPLENESVAALVTRAGIPLDEYKCSLNGERVADEDIWRTAIYPGQEIVLFPRAAGGKMFEMLSMMALTTLVTFLTQGAATGYMMAQLASTLGLSDAVTAGLVGAGLTIGGSMLISWAFSGGQSSAPAWSSSYDPTGPKGLAQPGSPVPKAYGVFGWCGNVVSSYVSFDGQDAYINCLVCFGWGQALSITDLLINEQDISVFLDCSYQVRLGTNDQPPIDGFDQTANGYPVEEDLLVANGPIVYQGTGTNIQGLDITVKFPSGLYRTTNDGNTIPLQFIYKIEVSPHDAYTWTSPLFANATQTAATTNSNGTQTWPAWVVMPTDRFAGSGIVYATDNGSHTPGDPWSSTETVMTINLDGSTGSTSATFTGEWQPCDPNLNPALVTDWWEGYRIVTNATTSAFFDTVSVYGLPAGQWDVRLTKIGYNAEGNDGVGLVQADSSNAQDVADGWFWNVNEIFWSNLAYPNMILVGVKALATSQLNGGSLKITATITHALGPDTVIPVALSTYEMDNPAVVCYDLLTNPLYGMGVAANLIDVPAFAVWAAFNDEIVTNQDGTEVRRHVFAGVFDQAGNAWTALSVIAGMSRAAIIQIGMQYTVVLDAPGDPVQLFTVGNTKKDSFTEQWVALDDRCTLIECNFADAARDYRMDLPVSVMTEADINSGLQPKITRTNLTGCTSRDQAWRWAYFQLMSTKLTLRSVQFAAPIEAVCCSIGSVIALQSDVVQWAVGGRVQPGSTLSTLNVERTDLTYSAAAGWTVSVQHPVVERGTATILSISGMTVTMTAPLPAGRIVKMVGPDGTEYIVQGTATSAVTVATLTPQAATVPLVAGNVVTLYDTNVIDTIDVTGLTVGPFGSVVTIAGTFSAVPLANSAWAYGQSAGAQPAKLFRVISIKKSGDFAFQIGAAEYNAELYEDVIPNYGEIVGVPDASPSISNLTLTEQFQNGTLTGSSNSSIVSVGWQNGNTAVGGQVQVQAVNASGQLGAWNTIGNIQGQGCTFVGTVGVTYNVSVTGFDWQGNLVGAPATASITVVAASVAPPNVTGFAGVTGSSATVLSWNSVVPTPDHYEIRWAQAPNTAWVNAAVLWDGSGSAWTDTTLRSGYYMIVAVGPLSTGSVESVTPAVWQSVVAVSSPLTPTSGTSITLPGYTYNGPPNNNITFSGISGAVAGVAIPSGLTCSVSVSPDTAGTFYTYLYLSGSPLTFSATGTEPWPSTGVPDTGLIASQVAAGDVIMMATWSMTEDGSEFEFMGCTITLVND